MRNKLKGIFRLEPLSRMLGIKGGMWFLIAILGSVLLALTDYGIAMLLDVLLKSLGVAAVTETSTGPFDLELSSTQLLLALLVVGLLRGLGQFGTYQGNDLVHEFVNSRLRLLSAHQILKSSDGDFVSSSTTNTNVGEVFPKAGMFVYYSVTMVTFAFQCIIYLLAMLYMAWKEALIGITGAVVIGLGVLIINKYVRRASAAIPAEHAGLVTGIQRTASNWLMVKALRTSDVEHAGLNLRIINYFKHFVKAKTLGNLGAVLPLIAGVFLLVVIIYCSITLFDTEGMALIGCIYLFTRFLLVAGRLAKGFGLLNSVSGHYKLASDYVMSFNPDEIQAATEVLDRTKTMRSTVEETAAATQHNSVDQNKRSDEQVIPPVVQLDGTSFRYAPGLPPVFNQLSLTVNPGEQIGIVGRSGAGKSTLLGLIFGVLKPSGGAVHIDGKPADVYFNENPGALGYVGAESYLIAGTIKDNLDYGAVRQYEDDEYRQALDSVHMLHVVNQLEGGILHVLNESGEGMSAGQKQRLSIARALLRDSAVLILDEVTSNLDNDLEHEVARVLEKLKGRCTVIMVSHRHGLLEYADKVYELNSSGQLMTTQQLESSN